MSAIEVTGVLQRDAWTSRTIPPVENLGGGIWSIPVPIPDNPLRYVLVYVLETSDGVVVVDCGWNTDSAWEALVGGLSAIGLAPADVRGALITHIHPDHYGLAGRLRESSGAWVALHPADAALLPGRYGVGIDEVVSRMRALLDAAGVPAHEASRLTSASLGIREFVDLVEPDVLLTGGSRAPLEGRRLDVIHTPGHSPGHVCFHDPDRGLLLSGDHLLPRITPTITVHVQQVANPLADYLDSLQRLRDLTVTEVLPAHEWRFRPMAARVEQLIRHHARRLEEILAIVTVADGVTAWEVAHRLAWSRPWDQLDDFLRRAAVGEALAHLHLLSSRGLVATIGSHPERWSAFPRSGADPVSGR